MHLLPEASESCRNCAAPMTRDSRFCASCGQKSTDGRITIGEFLSEFIESIFNVDSKIFRTLRDLFVPGKLTIAYFEGKHKSYLHPIRFCLLLTVLVIALINFGDTGGDGNISNNIIDSINESQQVHDFLLEADSLKGVLREHFNTPNAQIALDSFYRRISLRDSLYNDSLSIPLQLSGEPLPKIARKDWYELNNTELVEKYAGEKSFFTQLGFKQVCKIVKSDLDLISYFSNKISWIVLITIPFFALFLKLLYPRWYFIEQLVFCLHIHIFMFVIFFLVELLPFALPEALLDRWMALLITGLVIGFIAYTLLAMRRFYQQSWRTTIFKFITGQFMYWFILGFGITATVLLGFFLY